MKVCHFTSVHSTTDDRIFLKECQALKEAGYDVFLVGRGDSRELSGIQIVGCGEPKGRIGRFLFFSKKVYNKARALECDIYHFHDPELLRYGLKLKKQRKKVIFDSHEDIPAQILDKKWLPKGLRKIISILYIKYEAYVSKRLDAVITATSFIERKFYGRAKKTVTINNYPRLDDILYHNISFSERKPIVCYIGGISIQRGESVMCEAMRDVKGELIIAGEHEKETIVNGGQIHYVGQLDRNGVNEVLGKAVVGLVVLQPCANYINSQPIKLYEYMAAGIPVIYSNFPAWKNQMDSIGSGISIDPSDTAALANAINYLLDNREIAQNMGLKGRKAVEELFSWNPESVKLCRLYETI